MNNLIEDVSEADQGYGSSHSKTFSTKTVVFIWPTLEGFLLSLDIASVDDKNLFLLSLEKLH